MKIDSGSGIFREFHACIVPVSDPLKSRNFYEGILKLRPRKVLEDGSMVVYGTGNTTHICTYRATDFDEKPGYHGGGSFGNWRSDDARKAYDYLIESGVNCSDFNDFPGFKFFTFFDPEGNRFDVAEFGPDWLPDLE